LASCHASVSRIGAIRVCPVRARHRRLPPAARHDLQPRPTCHCKRHSIEARLSIMSAALAVSRWIEDVTGWLIRKFVRTARRYRTIQIQAGPHTITAAEPCLATFGKPSKRTSTRADVCTNLAQLGAL
jgi:hypothetical protein